MHGDAKNFRKLGETDLIRPIDSDGRSAGDVLQANLPIPQSAHEGLHPRGDAVFAHGAAYGVVRGVLADAQDHADGEIVFALRNKLQTLALTRAQAPATWRI